MEISLRQQFLVETCTERGLKNYHRKNFSKLFQFLFSKRAVENVQKHGKVCVLDIEIEGVKQVKNSHLNAIFVFIDPPSIEELERRLRARKTETEESLKKRLNTARKELEYGHTSGNFDIIVHNLNLKQAYHELRDFILNQLESQLQEGLDVCINRNPLSENDFNHD